MTMTTDAPLQTNARPGRPRSARADQAILGATKELLAEVGIEALSMEGVAARAGVGKTTIYRRWPSKEELILAAVRSLQREAPIADTGNLRNDLLTLARMAEHGEARDALERLLPRFLGEAASNPALIETYMATTVKPRMQQLIAMVERAQTRGEIRADVDPVIVINLFGGALMWGWMIANRLSPLPPDFIEQTVDTLWRGIRTMP
ncbi:MAG: TetR/AcrR family transcriptional regulator [Thermomicrobiales bacterium]